MRPLKCCLTIKKKKIMGVFVNLDLSTTVCPERLTVYLYFKRV